MKLKIVDTVYSLGLTETITKVLHINDFDTGASIKSLITGKGSLLAGTGVGALSERDAGTDGQILTLDSAETTGMKWATPAAGGATMTNKAGTSVSSGAVIIQNTAVANSFKTTTTLYDTVFGVAGEDIADNADGSVITEGISTVMVTGTVAIGDRLTASATAQRAQTGTYATFATALTANASGTGTVTALIDKQNLPTRFAFFWDEVTTSVTMTKTLGAANQYYAFTVGPTAANANDGDEYTMAFTIAAGTYHITTLGVKRNNFGKLDWYLDGVAIVTGQDWYSAGGYNQEQTISNIVMSAGRHVLKMKINGKNASSSDYALEMTKTWIKPTAD